VATNNFLLCPRQELNLHLFLRTELFYPLNYEDNTSNLAYKNSIENQPQWDFCFFQHYDINMSMNPEEKKLLEDTFALAEDNNKMLHSLKRSMRMQRIMSLLYWVFIIGSAVGAYYLIQPYVDQMIGVYGNASDVLKNFGQ